MKGNLYLIPTTLGDNEPLEVMPYSVKTIVEMVDHFIVENEKSARRFIKKNHTKKITTLSNYYEVRQICSRIGNSKLS